MLRQSLLQLFEQYFALLPTYRPLRRRATGNSSPYSANPGAPWQGRSDRCAGCALPRQLAAGQSPLTFCGFGSFVRHIGRTAMLVEYALRNNLLEEAHLQAIRPHQANLRVAWVYSRFMQPWPGTAAPTAVNRTMNIFCKALSEAGEDVTVQFLQDRYTFTDYLRIMLITARHNPKIFAQTANLLGPKDLMKWAGDMATFGCDDILRTAHRLAGRRRWRAVKSIAGRLSPSFGLRLKSARTRWQATS